MKDRTCFLLLDIDGVLLDSKGYLLAFLDTVNGFLHQFGQDHLSIGPRVSDYFQAEGIAAEWDMTPITLASFFEYRLSLNPDLPTPESVPSDPLEPVGAQDEWLAFLKEKIAACGTVWNRHIDILYENRALLFPRLAEQSILRELFLDTLHPGHVCFRSLMTRLLGSDTYRDFYGQKPSHAMESYLATRDGILISEKYRQLLQDECERLHPVVMTYRPSLLPGFDGNKTSAYFVNTPETECAMQLLRWDKGPIRRIGGGSISYIEEKYGLRREAYVKPHPFHALASLLYARCGDERTALETARLFCVADENGEYDRNPGEAILPLSEPVFAAVFEDSPSGVRSLANMAALLRRFGYDVEEYRCGIVSSPEKSGQLAEAGAVLYPDVNSAFDALIPQLL